MSPSDKIPVIDRLIDAEMAVIDYKSSLIAGGTTTRRVVYKGKKSE